MSDGGGAPPGGGSATPAASSLKRKSKRVDSNYSNSDTMYYNTDPFKYELQAGMFEDSKAPAPFPEIDPEFLAANPPSKRVRQKYPLYELFGPKVGMGYSNCEDTLIPKMEFLSGPAETMRDHLGSLEYEYCMGQTKGYRILPQTADPKMDVARQGTYDPDTTGGETMMVVPRPRPKIRISNKAVALAQSEASAGYRVPDMAVAEHYLFHSMVHNRGVLERGAELYTRGLNQFHNPTIMAEPRLPTADDLVPMPAYNPSRIRINGVIVDDVTRQREKPINGESGTSRRANNRGWTSDVPRPQDRPDGMSSQFGPQPFSTVAGPVLPRYVASAHSSSGGK